MAFLLSGVVSGCPKFSYAPKRLALAGITFPASQGRASEAMVVAAQKNERVKEHFMAYFSRISGNLLFGLLVVLVAASLGFAQTGTTSLHGTVSDKTGAVIAAAKVTLTNAQQGLQREVNTNGSGEYEFLGLPPGT